MACSLFGAGAGTQSPCTRRPDARAQYRGLTAASVPEDVGYDRAAMADQTQSQPLDQQLQEIGAQLAWVRDYL